MSEREKLWALIVMLTAGAIAISLPTKGQAAMMGGCSKIDVQGTPCVVCGPNFSWDHVAVSCGWK